MIKFELDNGHGKPVKGDIRFNENGGKMPAVFLLHGFKGYKDWGFFPYVAESLANSGTISIAYNFSYNGMAEGSDLVENVDDFAQNTASRQLDDSINIISAFKAGDLTGKPFVEERWNGQIFLVGHSLGGAISILTASKLNNVSGIVLWASISTLTRYTEHQKEAWRKAGKYEFTNQRTGQKLRLDLEYLEDIEKNETEYNLPKLISQLEIPVLIIHGRQDITVPFREAQLLASSGRPGIRVEEITNTGHTFGIEHPFEKTTNALETAIDLTKNFIGVK